MSARYKGYEIIELFLFPCIFFKGNTLNSVTFRSLIFVLACIAPPPPKEIGCINPPNRTFYHFLSFFDP